MPIVTLFGTLHPKHHRLNPSKTFSISWGNKDLGFPLIMQAKIVDSRFEVTCDLPKFEAQMLSVLYARAVNLVRGYSDAVSFALGVGFTITVDKFRGPDGQIMDVQRVNSALGSLCTAYRFPPRNSIEEAEFEKILPLILGEPNLMGSLTDLADALAFHHQTPTNCGRVLDSLRKAIAPNVEPGSGWGILQSLLRVTRPFREFVTSRSTDTRHGERSSEIPEEALMEILRRTWQIMNRFIEFRKRGGVQLPEDEFPELHEGQ